MEREPRSLPQDLVQGLSAGQFIHQFVQVTDLLHELILDLLLCVAKTRPGANATASTTGRVRRPRRYSVLQQLIRGVIRAGIVRRPAPSPRSPERWNGWNREQWISPRQIVAQTAIRPGRLLCRLSPRVAMVEPAQAGQRNQSGIRGRLWLDRASVWRVFL